MPYVNDEARERIDAGGPVRTNGELNYAVSMVLVRYLQFLLKRDGKLAYATLKAAISDVSGAADEAKRRLLDPYEDGACCRNGDIYPDSILHAVGIHTPMASTLRTGLPRGEQFAPFEPAPGCDRDGMGAPIITAGIPPVMTDKDFILTRFPVANAYQCWDSEGPGDWIVVLNDVDATGYRGVNEEAAWKEARTRLSHVPAPTRAAPPVGPPVLPPMEHQPREVWPTPSSDFHAQSHWFFGEGADGAGKDKS